MSIASQAAASLRHADRFFIGGEWVQPSSGATINAFRTDFGIAFGGFKQSGLGREGGTEGLHPFLETKTVILDGPPAKYRK